MLLEFVSCPWQFLPSVNFKQLLEAMFNDKQGLSVMVFSTEESTNKVVVCAGVSEKGDKGKLDVSEWLSNALGSLKGRCGKGKGGLVTGQVSINRLTLIITQK
jgi:hypothetical protein